MKRHQNFTTLKSEEIIALTFYSLNRLFLLFEMKKTDFIDCFACKHFYVTWDQNNPKGCRAFGFKTKKMPSMVVFENSGEKCLKFELKDEHKKQQEKKAPKKRGWTA
ncbi:hypothetical protein [Thiomicrorhabdus indica]|uniref:hypothetical protein n=1 Tax=Thiomicrorhabdus indica TaxID=2267253 RepID=UPI002AA8BA88|nr:hypothetical protein [Thiomicrorhabdus indica]